MKIGTAKVTTLNELVKYPYTWNDFCVEFPNVTIDLSGDLASWYDRAIGGPMNSTLIVDVIQQRPPLTFDDRTQKLEKSTIPAYNNAIGKWVLNWNILPKSKAEIDDYDRHITTNDCSNCVVL